jgi:hypothetical protein
MILNSLPNKNVTKSDLLMMGNLKSEIRPQTLIIHFIKIKQALLLRLKSIMMKQDAR